MKLAISIAILRTKPQQVSTECYVQTLGTSWRNRNQRDDKYIRWLELERLKLLQETLFQDSSSSIQTSSSPVSLQECELVQINVSSAAQLFLKSTTQFLQLKVAPVHATKYSDILTESTGDLVRNIKVLMKERDLFLGTFSGLLEECSKNFHNVSLSKPSLEHLTQLCEMLVTFVVTNNSNKLLPPKDNNNNIPVKSPPEKTRKPKQEQDYKNPFAEEKEEKKEDKEEIKLTLSDRSEKQVLVNCVVNVGKNPQLKPIIQDVLIHKICEICENLDSYVVATKPGLIDTLYYLIEGLYQTGDICQTNSDVLKKCIDTTILKFPLASRFLLVCCVKRNSEGSKE